MDGPHRSTCRSTFAPVRAFALRLLLVILTVDTEPPWELAFATEATGVMPKRYCTGWTSAGIRMGLPFDLVEELLAPAVAARPLFLPGPPVPLEPVP